MGRAAALVAVAAALAAVSAGQPGPQPPAAGRAPAGVTHHAAEVNGVRLHYVTAGKGDPVVLLHGWPQTWYEWRHVIPLLADKYTVIAPDLRGLGDSDKPAGGYDVRTQAADIVGLLDHLKAGPVRLVGHDLGGPVAYAVAALHPDRVRRLALVEAPLFGVEVPGAEAETGKYWHLRFHQELDLPEALIGGRERAYLSWFYRQHAHNPVAITPADVDEYVRCYSAPGGLRAGFAHYRAIPESTAQIKELSKVKLRMPALGLGSEKVLKDLPLRALKVAAEDARGGVIEKCGHWVPEERPDYLAEQLLKFFRDDPNP